MNHYYVLYEKAPGHEASWLTVISGLKIMRSTLKNFAARTSNRILVLDAVSGRVVATANARR
jgi:hypothetical protein